RSRPQDIRWLDVAVNNAGLMRVIESFPHVIQDAQNFADRHAAVFLNCRLEGFALDERHRKVEEIVVVTGGEQRNYVRVLKLRGYLHLPPEPAPVYFSS